MFGSPVSTAAAAQCTMATVVPLVLSLTETGATQSSLGV